METSKLDSAQDELSQVDKGATELVASLSIEGVAVIPIAQFDKYVVTCEMSEPSTDNFRKVRQLAQTLDQWWRGDGKFFVLMQGDGMPKIRFERLEIERLENKENESELS